MGKRLKALTLNMIGGANIATVVFMLLVGYSGNINPEGHGIMAATGLFFPVFLVINFGFLVFWIIFHRRGALIPLAGYIIAYVPVRTYTPFNYPADPPEGAIKVLSYNAFNFNSVEAGRGEDNLILRYILDSDADIVCLQEAELHHIGLEDSSSVIKSVYPYCSVSSSDLNRDILRLYSKYPILSVERIPYESRSNLSIAYTIEIKGDTVLVVNNHFESNRLNQEDKENFKSIVRGDMSNKEARKESKLLIAKLAEAARKRAPQVRAVSDYVADRMRKDGISAIVCGDFNDNPISYTHKTLSENLSDCYIASGNGPGFSYHRSGMYVRIDNIFCSKEWTPYAAEVDNKIGMSDHYPIICWLKKQ